MTAAANPLAQFLARQLAVNHQVRLTERIQVNLPSTDAGAAQSPIEFVRSPLDHDDGTNLLVRGMDAIVHVAEPLSSDDEYTQIDILTRCTYNLLMAAAAEGVPHLLLLSTLALMTEYGSSYRVSERWRPQPSTEPALLSKHLAEFTAREFAREHKINVTVLRLGTIAYPESPRLAAHALPQVDAHVVARAVDNVLGTAPERWSIYHIGNEATHPHFTTSKAKAKALI